MSDSDGEEKGLVIDISKKKTTKMVATRLGRGSRGGRNNDDEDIDDVGNEKSSPELAITKFQKRIFNNTRENDDYKESDEDSDRGGSWMDEKREKTMRSLR